MTSTSSRLNRVHALANLLDDEPSGVRRHVVEFALADDNATVGVTAQLSAPLDAGAPILSVPLEAVISAFTVLNDSRSPFSAMPGLADALAQLTPAESDHHSTASIVVARADVVAVYLCLIWLRFAVDDPRHATAPPVWRAFVDALPARVGTPLQWSESELDLLDGTNARFATRSLHIALWRMYEALMPALAVRFGEAAFPDHVFDYPHLVWAYEMFWSRCMAVPHLHGPTLPALVPLVDLLNHDPAARVDYTTDPASRRFGLITRVPLAAGMPVCNNYGARSNERLLLLYGFALDNNDVDDVQLRIGVDDEELGRHKLALLRDHAASAGWDIAQRLPRDGSIRPSLRWTMRVLAATRLELYAWSSERVAVQLARERDVDDGTSFGVGAVTARNEAASLHALSSLLHERLRSICEGDVVAATQVATVLGAAAPPTDFASAAELLDAALREPSLPDTYRSALIYRVGQRRIVAAAAQQADALRSELASAFVLDGRALYARFVGGYASYGVTGTQPVFVEFAPAVCTTQLAQASGSAEGVDVERRRTHVAPDVAFLALGAPCTAGDVLVRVPLANALSFPGVPPSAALLGVAEGALDADELEQRWRALCDALLASGFEIDDIAALWLAAERTEAERDTAAALADTARWWRGWLLSMNTEGKSFAALAWSSTEWQAMLHTPSMIDAAAGVARALERHCDQLFAHVGSSGGVPRALFMTPQRYAWANDLIATRGVRDSVNGHLCVVPLNALPAPAPSGVGCVERVVDVASQSLILRALCALPAGAVLTEFGGECGGSSWFTAEERLLHGGFAYAPDSEHDADCGLISHFPISVSFAASSNGADDNDDDDDDGAIITDTDGDGGNGTILNLPDSNADLAAFDGPGSEASRHALLSEPRIANRLLATLRSAIAGVPVTEATERISLANEGAAIATLQNVVQEAGGRFPTRMAADQAALAVMTNGAADATLAPALVPQRDAWLAMLERFGESHAWRVAAALSFMISSKSAIAATWARLGEVIRALEDHRQGRARTDEQ